MLFGNEGREDMDRLHIGGVEINQRSLPEVSIYQTVGYFGFVVRVISGLGVKGLGYRFWRSITRNYGALGPLGPDNPISNASNDWQGHSCGLVRCFIPEVPTALGLL